MKAQSSGPLLCFDYNGFDDYLTSIAGGNKSKTTAKSIVTDIKNYFYFTNPTSEERTPYYDLLLNMSHLKNYLQHLQHNFHFAATTISEKLRRLRLAVDYTLYKENPDECNTAMFMRCTKVITNLSKWGKSLSKDVQKQRHKQSLVSAQKVLHTSNVSLNDNSYMWVTEHRYTQLITLMNSLRVIKFWKL